MIAGDTAKCEYSQAVTDNPFDPSVWQPVEGFELTDITYHRLVIDGKPQPTVRVAFRGIAIGKFRPDLLVEETVVVEVKSVDRLLPLFELQLQQDDGRYQARRAVTAASMSSVLLRVLGTIA